MPSSEGQQWPVGLVGKERGEDAAVGICTCKMIQSVTAILGRQRLCFLGAIRGHGAEAVRDPGKANGMGWQGGQRNKRFPF